MKHVVEPEILETEQSLEQTRRMVTASRELVADSARLVENARCTNEKFRRHTEEARQQVAVSKHHLKTVNTLLKWPGLSDVNWKFLVCQVRDNSSPLPGSWLLPWSGAAVIVSHRGAGNKAHPEGKSGGLRGCQSGHGKDEKDAG